jgi:hypothetical protein
MDSGFVVRGAGVGVACLVPGWRWRALTIAGTYVAGWYVGEHGFQVFSVTGFELPTSAVSWTALQLAATAAVRRLPVPAPVGGAAYGAAVAWLDGRATQLVRSRAAAREATA